jgi:hypothetical protein
MTISIHITNSSGPVSSKEERKILEIRLMRIASNRKITKGARGKCPPPRGVALR